MTNRYEWSFDRGMPRRYTHKEFLVLDKGPWERVLYNERHSPYRGPGMVCGPNRWYEKWLFNIGCYDVLAPRVFLDSPATRVCSAMELLW